VNRQQSQWTEAETIAYLRQRRNWGRWGGDDQRGTINLITPEKRLAAARLVRSGRAVSLSRPWPKAPAANNPNPAQHWLRAAPRTGAGAGVATDYYAIAYHGQSATHIDALCHVWGDDGLWNGRRPEEIRSEGTLWGGVENWSDGIITRGVLLDVPRFRGEPFVTLEKPVTGSELDAIAGAQGVSVEPGDAVAVYSGREAYDAAHAAPWGSPPGPRPGLHASCLTFLREHDASVLLWDMMDASPGPRESLANVHSAIWAFGLPLVEPCWSRSPRLARRSSATSSCWSWRRW